MPKGARTGQSEGAQARMSLCMPNGGGTCPRECAQAKQRGRACQTDGAHAQGSAHMSFSMQNPVFPKGSRMCPG